MHLGVISYRVHGKISSVTIRWSRWSCSVFCKYVWRSFVTLMLLDAFWQTLKHSNELSEEKQRLTLKSSGHLICMFGNHKPLFNVSSLRMDKFIILEKEFEENSEQLKYTDIRMFGATLY